MTHVARLRALGAAAAAEDRAAIEAVVAFVEKAADPDRNWNMLEPFIGPLYQIGWNAAIAYVATQALALTRERPVAS